MRAYERFMKYAAFPTMSDGDSSTIPSTAKQLKLAAALCEELSAIGLKDAKVDEYGYVYATLEANCDKEINTRGLIAHMDTSSEASDTDIKMRIVDYNGGDITLNAEKNIVMKTSDLSGLSGCGFLMSQTPNE